MQELNSAEVSSGCGNHLFYVAFTFSHHFLLYIRNISSPIVSLSSLFQSDNVSGIHGTGLQFSYETCLAVFSMQSQISAFFSITVMRILRAGVCHVSFLLSFTQSCISYTIPFVAGAGGSRSREAGFREVAPIFFLANGVARN